MPATTIIHVAERAGVSVTTVSRVLNGKPYVREEIRDRVLAAARDLRFRPKISARSLAGRRSFVICKLLSAMSTYGMLAQLGALEVCRRNRYHLVVETIDDADPNLEAELEGLLGSVSMDGVLLMPPACDNDTILGVLERHGMPYVRVSPATRRPGHPTVAVNDAVAARALTDHLLDLGHRRIGFVGGMEDHLSARERFKGFKAALASRGVPFDPALVASGGFIFDAGYTAAERLLAAEPRPTAIFAANDLSALGVMARAFDLGLRTPRDLSVVGFDDIMASSMVRPALTTMRQPVSEMVAAATELLIAGASDAGAPAPGRRTFTCELVVRGSTAPPPPAF